LHNIADDGEKRKILELVRNSILRKNFPGFFLGKFEIGGIGSGGLGVGEDDRVP